jgi:Subtilase family
LVTQAVNEVTADGALYFSSAGNFGNLTDGTSTVYESDFVDGGALPLIPGGTVHAFGPGVTSNQRTAVGNGSVILWWSDPLGGSANDYDLYLLDSTGSRVVAVSNNIQDGIQDPNEVVISNIAGARIVILKKTGAQDRFLHLQSIQGKMVFSTSGEIAGHAMAAEAYAVAATPAAQAGSAATNPVGPYPNPFNSSSQSELFTSDGPRRIFYKADGTLYTPGDVSSAGGILRQKPDITAADGVSCAAPGFARFFGTSAAAPHAAAIAALIKSAVPGMTPSQVRTVLLASAIDIEAPGADRDTGAGIIMAPEALRAAGAPRLPLPVLDLSSTRYTAESNPNGQLDPGETVSINLCLRNAGASTTVPPTGTLEAMDSVVDPSGPQNFNIPSYGVSNCQPFTFKIGGEYGENVRGALKLTLAEAGSTRELGTLTFSLGLIGTPQTEIAITEFLLGLNELPTGWTTTTAGAGEPWIGLDEGVPGVFTPAIPAVGESSLISPPVKITSPRARLSFVHSFLTNEGIPLIDGLDGGVLEIKIGGGEFQDILEAGGSFEAGGYTNFIFGPLSCLESNPLFLPLGRSGWVSDSRRWSIPIIPILPQGHLQTEVKLPPSADGQTIQLRWRFGADCLGAIEGGGWRIYSVELISGYNNPTP